MNRRGFLKILGGAGVAIAAAELLIPERTFFLPPRGGWLQPTLPSLIGYTPLEQWVIRSRTRVMFITNPDIHARGPGSFHEAMSAGGPRVIVPTVSGIVPASFADAFEKTGPRFTMRRAKVRLA